MDSFRRLGPVYPAAAKSPQVFINLDSLKLSMARLIALEFESMTFAFHAWTS
jgi:hypothetical protein